jgi:hypothetical protein
MRRVIPFICANEGGTTNGDTYKEYMSPVIPLPDIEGTVMQVVRRTPSELQMQGAPREERSQAGRAQT